jgi:putative colanic acid biosynthesis acetyltransferase WcaF
VSVEDGLSSAVEPTGDGTDLSSELGGALPGEGPLRIDLSKVPSDTPFKVKLLRGLWGLFQIPFWPHTPQALSPLRIALLRLFGAEIGPGCLIGAGVKIWVPWNLTMGERTAIGADTEIQNFVPVVIGRHVVISQRNYICTSTHDHTHPYFPTISTPITIGSQSWIASECVLGPGAEIGEGAVISVRSVVSKAMPPWMICAGNPCRPLMERVIREV